MSPEFRSPSFGSTLSLPPRSRSQASSIKKALAKIARIFRGIKRTKEDPEVPRLAHRLDRVLFNPTPHQLQDPHTGVYNFAPELQTVPTVESFDFDRVPTFKSSSEHPEFQDLARKAKRSFVGSTSSLTGLLSQIYFLVSRGQGINARELSGRFGKLPKKFTPSALMPAKVFLEYKDGVYSVISGDKVEDLDIEKVPPGRSVLSDLGIILENFLTKEPNQFHKLLKSTSDISNDEIERMKGEEQAYQYSMTKSMALRSQLDAWDHRLPGTGHFDLKTRAVIAIRRDLSNYEENSGYAIRTMKGLFESYEREHYDLLRSGMLKYFFQTQIGDMDGIFLAYHNTRQIFGFQYMNTADMEVGLFGTKMVGAGETIFRTCLGLLEKILEAIKKFFPEQSVRVMFDTNQNHGLRVWIMPSPSLEDATPQTNAPPTELLVTVNHYSDNIRSRSPLWKNDKSYSMEYHIRHTPPSSATYHRFNAACKRYEAIGILPDPDPISHISTKRPKVMRTIGESGPPKKATAKFKTKRAWKDPMLPKLRRMSRNGRNWSHEMKEKWPEVRLWTENQASESIELSSVEKGKS